MTDVVVIRKCARILQRVDRIREILPDSAEAFRGNRLASEAAIFNLFLALQESIDLAMHVVAARGWGVPGDARGGFSVLERRGILEPSLSDRLARAVGLRNRIAHEYGELELDRIYAIMAGELGDLEDLAAAVEGYVASGA